MVQKYSKHEVILEEGKVNSNLYFLASGSVCPQGNFVMSTGICTNWNDKRKYDAYWFHFW